MSTQTEFDRLSGSQQLILGYAAYRGGPIEDQFLKDFTKAYQIDDTEQALYDLKDKGYYTSSGGIDDANYLKFIGWVFENHREWPSEFERRRFRRKKDIRNLWEAYFDAESGVHETLTLPRRHQQLIAPLLKESRYYHILDNVSGIDFGNILTETLRCDLKADSLTETYLENLTQNLDFYRQRHKTSMPSCVQLFDEINLCKYFVTGIELQRSRGLSRSELYAEAIRVLHQNDSAVAVDLFNGCLARKDCPDDPVVAYFYILALLKNGTEAGRLERIRTSETISPALRLMASLQSASDDEIISKVNAAKTFATPLEQQFLFLASRYTNLGNLQCVNKLSHIPNNLLMRNEFSSYLHLPEEEKSRMNEAFGGGSVIASLVKRVLWKSTLSDVEALLKQSEKSTTDEFCTRVKYVFYDYSIQGIIEQKLQLDGTWGEDKLLSYSKFLEGGYSFMNETDKTIALALIQFDRDRASTYRNQAEAVMPHLIGSDRVFGPHGQVEISAEKPHVKFSIKKDKIVASANVDVRNDGHIFPCKVESDIYGNCRVIAPSPKQRRIMDLLLQVRDIPVSAAKSVSNLGNRMRGLLDVDISSLQALSQAPTLQGTGRIIVQINPFDGQKSFMINWQALPVDAGEVRFIPGDGSSDYIEAYEEGKPYRVVRDLQKEMANLNDLTDFITGMPACAFPGNTRLEIRGTEKLLPLLEFLHDRPDDYSVEWPKGTEIKFRGKAAASCWEIGLKSNIKWFDVVGNVNINGTQISLKNILEEGDLREDGSEYVRISEKEYIRISKAIQKQLLSLMGMMTGGSMQISKYQVGKLAETLGMGGLPVAFDKDYTDQLQRMQEACAMEPDVPSGLNATLHEYQKEGYRWMCRLSHWGAGGCLADDMGLGKTVQTIAFMLSKVDKGPSLVITPTSVVPNWESEIKKFAPGLRPIIINNVRERAMAVRNTGPGDVVISSYGVLANSTDALRERDWNVICLDEAHMIKNRWTRVSHAVMELRGDSRIILTGTPVQNSLNDLWNLFQFINPGMLGKFDTFKEKYFSKDDTEAAKRLEVLKSFTQPFILRRTKDQVLDEMPLKTEIDYMVSLSPDESDCYEQMRAGCEHSLSMGGADISVFEALTKLRLACCSMGIQDTRWRGGSSKLKELKYILQNIYNDDSHILIFSQFTSFLALVKKMLKDMGIPFLYLDGAVPMEQRPELVRQFQDGDFRVFLISLKAGGLGLNLTAANHVILLDPWWNPSIEEQAIDRAYRIGQTQDVTVIRMLAANTIEQKIVTLQDRKRNLSGHILQGTGSSNALTYEEILEMVSPF